MLVPASRTPAALTALFVFRPPARPFALAVADFFNHGVFNDIWGSHLSPKKHGTVVDALGLMLALRRRGVRSHFWV